MFHSLTQLQDLLLPDNNIQMMPELPVTMRRIDLRNNKLISRGLHAESFKVNLLHTYIKMSAVDLPEERDG